MTKAWQTTQQLVTTENLSPFVHWQGFMENMASLTPDNQIHSHETRISEWTTYVHTCMYGVMYLTIWLKQIIDMDQVTFLW